MTAVADKPRAIQKADYDRPAAGLGGLQRLGEPLLPQIRAAMPGFLARNAERFMRALCTECQRSPKLLDCSPRSLFGGVIQVAALGLELGGPAGQSYLIPFKGEAQLVVGYKGFIVLAHRSRSVGSITPRTVREGDAFEIVYGTDQRITHRPAFQVGAPSLGYYCAIKLANGGIDFEYMTKAEAEFHRNKFALSQKGPWASDFDEMAKKTCIRKLAKRMPLSVEWVAAASLDEMAEHDVPQQLSAAVVLEGEDPSLRDRLDKAKRPEGYVAGIDDAPATESHS